jgi:RHS repeat-associated protein
MSWDVENRLVAMWRGPWLAQGSNSTVEELVAWNPLVGTVWRWGYDHRTRRVWRNEPGPEGLGRVTSVVAFSGGTSVAEFSGPTLSLLLARGVDIGGGTRRLLWTARRETGSAETGSAVTLRFNRYNSRGDVVGQSDAAGVTTWAATYQADGRRTGEVGTNLNPKHATGRVRELGVNRDRHRANTKEEDPTGLLNEGFRYRDMETGTFISRDPLGHVDGPNVYCYVGQNPWTKFDPLGLEEQVIGVVYVIANMRTKEVYVGSTKYSGDDLDDDDWEDAADAFNDRVSEHDHQQKTGGLRRESDTIVVLRKIIADPDKIVEINGGPERPGQDISRPVRETVEYEELADWKEKFEEAGQPVDDFRNKTSWHPDTIAQKRETYAAAKGRLSTARAVLPTNGKGKIDGDDAPWTRNNVAYKLANGKPITWESSDDDAQAIVGQVAKRLPGGNIGATVGGAITGQLEKIHEAQQNSAAEVQNAVESGSDEEIIEAYEKYGKRFAPR